MQILEAHGIESGYGDVQVLWGVSLALEAGHVTALVGGNGAGKTTLLSTLVGRIRPRRGRIVFQGEDVTRLAAHARTRRGLVLVPEGRRLFTEMTVLENLQMGATPKRARARMRPNLDRVLALFPRLSERTRQKAGTLSGGEQQMLAVARGLMSEPSLLMVDELSLGLAPVLAVELFRALLTLKDDGLSILLVEQNVSLALGASDHAYVLREGRIELSGPASEVKSDERVRRAYLGIACDPGRPLPPSPTAEA
ncbi:MAG: ABC transporter ATP-binding protein [Planctomycetes bacterium]|nr:ABC transporter ATP-binding protein [Planctomycetota bacterium]